MSERSAGSAAAGWLLILLAVAAVGLLGAGIAWMVLSVLAAAIIERRTLASEAEEGAFLRPGKATALSAMWAAWAAVLGSVATGIDGLASGGRLAVAGLALVIAGIRIRDLWRQPGADRYELAWQVIRQRARLPLAAVLVLGIGAVVTAALVSVAGGPLPLIVGLGALLVSASRAAKRRARAIERLRVLAANLGRVADPASVYVDVAHWLAGSDDVIDSAAVLYPSTSWIAPADPAPMQRDFSQAGWRCQVFPEDRALGLERMEAPVPLPDRDLLDPHERPNGLALRLGVMRDHEGQVIPAMWDPDAADPHLLAVGPTKSGKSVLLRCLLAQAVAGGWAVIIADPKGVDYRWASGLPGVVVRASGDRAFEGLDAAVEEMHHRQTWMEEHAPPTATNLSEAPGNPFPNMLVVVDELAELLVLGDKQRTKATSTGLGSLARRSRFVNMVMVVATQRPDAAAMGGEIRGNLGTRVLTGEGEQQHKLMAFGTPDVAPLPAGYPRGRGRLMVGGSGPHELQVAYIDPGAVLDTHLPRDQRAANAPPAEWDGEQAERPLERPPGVRLHLRRDREAPDDPLPTR